MASDPAPDPTPDRSPLSQFPQFWSLLRTVVIVLGTVIGLGIVAVIVYVLRDRISLTLSANITFTVAAGAVATATTIGWAFAIDRFHKERQRANLLQGQVDTQTALLDLYKEGKVVEVQSDDPAELGDGTEEGRKK